VTWVLIIHKDTISEKPHAYKKDTFILKYNILNRSNLIKIILVAIFYYLTGKISLAISHENDIVTLVIFASEGLALASILLFGYSMAIGIFIGQLLLVITAISPSVAILIALVNAIEALIALKLFKVLNLNKKLASIKDVFGLILIILFILQPFSAFFSNIILLFFSIIETSDLLKSFFSWWFGNIMGQILITPTLLLLYTHIKETNFLKLILIGFSFSFISYFFQVIFPLHNVSLLLSLTLPLIIYLSSQKGIQYATFSVIVITATTLYLTHLNLGIFTTDSKINNLINLNFYFLSQMLLLLIIGTLFNERKKRENELEMRIEEELKKNQEQTVMMLQQSRLAQMGQILNMITHQWRQPLNNLLLINEVFVYKYGKNKINSKDVQIFQEEYTLQIKQMAGTIDDFKDFFQPRKEKSSFLINDIIEHLIEIITPILNKSNINITFTQEKDIYMLGYSNELAQALLNILYNAKDALISNTIENKSIHITLKQHNQHIELNIYDNAGGISETIIKEIFRPYFSTKTELKGTGLGLYMSKLIIEQHLNGYLSVKNNQDGAKFTIQLQAE